MSEVKVNKISPRTACGTTTLGDSGDTFNVPCGSKINLASGGNLTVASGATITNNGTQTGFGRTGTVDWITTPKVTGDSPITGVTGKGYFLNTTAGEITINLPAGAAGSIVSMADYAATWQTNKVTVAPNGSEKIGAIAENATLNTEGQSVTFVYVDSVQGWVNTMDSTSNVRGTPPYIVATGGTPCTGAICGDYKVHSFIGPGTLCVSNAGGPGGSTILDYLVVAGGGGSRGNGGGAGAGGFRVSNSYSLPAPLTSPLATPTGITAAVQGYPIVVGGGAAGAPASALGSSSSFTTITSTGGGMSGGQSPGDAVGQAGGSGGGGCYNSGPVQSGGAGNTPPVSPSQGNAGGPGHFSAPPAYSGGGGGGAGAVGNPGGPPYPNGQGGIGSYIAPAFGSSYGTPGPVAARYFAGGGGADCTPGNSTPIAGGAGGGGDGGGSNNGADNTGGGAGGNPTNPGNTGGSGIVIIRYKFQ